MVSPVARSKSDFESNATANTSSTTAMETSNDETATVRVDALSFCRLECDHGELFLPEYKRSNRTKGLKILRCFPHCCPNHIERSYCGSSLHVIVQTTPTSGLSGSTTGSGSTGSGTTGTSGSATRAKLADAVFLFARFECSTDDGLRVGDTLPSSAVVRDTQSEDNPEGTWIPGIKERASTLASAMKRVSQAISDHTLVYQLNGKVYSRWYYDWESGANKAQRLMRHVLKAYVFERCPDTSDGGTGGTGSGTGDATGHVLRVIGVVSSPEFTVISYRRAPSEGLLPAGTAVGKADAAPREPSPSPSLVLSGRGSSRDDGRAHPQHPHQPHPHYATKRLSATSTSDTLDNEAKRRRRLATGSASASGTALVYTAASSVAAPPVTLRNATQPELFEDRVLWEHANARLVTVSKNLALVYYFLQWTPLDYYAAFVDELVHLMNHQVLEPLVVTSTDQKLEKLNSFARVLLDHAQRQPTSRVRGTAPPVLSRELDVLLRAMAQAAVWFFSGDMRAWTRAFVERHAAALTDKALLRHAFLQWLVELEAQLDRAVFATSSLQSLANAAEEIIAAVYTHELFHPKRPVVRQILGEHGFLGWRAFVAQMRDSFIAFSSAHTRDQRLGLRTAAVAATATAAAVPRAVRTVPLHAVERAWTGDWALDVEESTWKAQDATAAGDGLSLVAVLDLMAQLARIHVTLQLEQRLLCVASRAAFGSAHVEAMKLVLDGKSRVFRFSPHGWSTAMGEGADGDYVASTRFETPDRLIAYVETFRWSRMPGARSYHVRMRIECWKQQRLFVNGDVLETVSNAGFPHDDLQFMPERTIGAKMKMVNRVFIRQPPMAMALPLPGLPGLPLLPHHSSAGVPPGVAAGGSASGSGSGASPSAWRRLGGFRLVYARARR